jgi:hypothetical protein
MTERSDEEIRRLLKQTFPRVNAMPRHDLWPAMHRRLAEPAPRLPWYDWALAGAVVGAVAFFPQLILVLVYHL